MALPEIEKHRIDKAIFELMVQKAPAFVQNLIKISTATRGNKVNLVEERPNLQDPTQWTEHRVAQFEYVEQSKKWNLFYYDGKLKRYPYPNGTNQNLDKLVAQVINDPTGIFWG